MYCARSMEFSTTVTARRIRARYVMEELCQHVRPAVDITAIGRTRHLCEVDRQLYISDTIWSVQDPFPILNIVVPHSPQVPRVADLPFFIVTCWAFLISRLSRHFRQYPVIELSFQF